LSELGSRSIEFSQSTWRSRNTVYLSLSKVGDCLFSSQFPKCDC